MKKKTNWKRQAAETRSGIGRYPSEGFGYNRYGYSRIPGKEDKEERLTSPQENKPGRRTTRSGTIGQRKSTRTRPSAQM
jgi:hypothetical protein